MNSMKWNVMLIKKYLFHFIIILFLVTYLLSANFLFDKLIKVKGESQIVTINLPGASEDIQFYIDQIYENKIEWKDMISITGWGFIKNQSTENTSTYIVLDNTTTRYVFTTTFVKRPDVSEYFNKSFNGELNTGNSGFEANLPKVDIDNNRYRLGILIENQTAQKYILTNYYCTNGNCSLMDTRTDL
jgi:hypothetical protein